MTFSVGTPAAEEPAPAPQEEPVPWVLQEDTENLDTMGRPKAKPTQASYDDTRGHDVERSEDAAGLRVEMGMRRGGR